DPDDADRRHRQARGRRRVDHPKALPDGMASIYAVLPAVDAASLDTVLNAAAQAAKDAGSRLGSDALRADALALVAHTALDTGHIGPLEPPPPVTTPNDAPVTTPDDDEATVSNQAPAATRVGGKGMRLARRAGRRPEVQVPVPLSVLLP